jgi:hypothetical protein
MTRRRNHQARLLVARKVERSSAGEVGIHARMGRGESFLLPRTLQQSAQLRCSAGGAKQMLMHRASDIGLGFSRPDVSLRFIAGFGPPAVRRREPSPNTTMCDSPPWNRERQCLHYA